MKRSASPPLPAAFRAKAIVESLGGVWRETQGTCRCPAHDDRSPSLSVRLGHSAILFHCFAGCDNSQILKALESARLHDRQPAVIPEHQVHADTSAVALRLWKTSTSIAGTPAEAYLIARGLAPPFPRALRYNSAAIVGTGSGRRAHPALIAAFENDLGVVSVQRTILDPADILRKPLAKSKLALGNPGTAAIRLAAPVDELGLAEGIEDALTAMAWFGTPTWALGGVERLAVVAIPERVRRIIVYGDRGAAAARLLDKAREHLCANGRELISRIPDNHDDWNDAWRAKRQVLACPPE